MSRLIISLNETTEEDLKKLELPKQAKEILGWMFHTYGVGKQVPQPQLFEELDSHQEDNQILSTTPKQPISRIFQFYRKRLGDEKIITIDKSAEEKKEKVAKEPGSKASSKRRKDAPVGEEMSKDGVL